MLEAKSNSITFCSPNTARQTASGNCAYRPESISTISASPSPLLRELIEAQRLARHPDIAYSVPARVRGGGVAWGFATVEADDRFYQPSPDGRSAALITAAYERIGGRSCIVDLVATSLASGATRLRTGDGVLLGADYLALALLREWPVRLYEDPRAWLMARGHGVVVLDWREAVYRLADAPSLVCQTPALAGRMRDAFARPIALPPLLVKPSQELLDAA